MEKQCGADCACVVQGAGGIDRRAFLTQSGMTALAAALAACGLSNSPTAPGSLSQPVTITLSEHPSLATVDGVAFVSDTNGNPLAVVRTGTSTFVALSRICPHAGSTVNTASFGFLCPGHGAEFDFSGHWMGGQRTSSLTSYPTQYNAAAGTVTIG
jgi:nitrite reductase/ring-hydroxylating ferredoxin subunit